jgi:hypothetical protein
MKKKSYTLYFYSNESHTCVRQTTIVADSLLDAYVDASKLKTKEEYVGKVE